MKRSSWILCALVLCFLPWCALFSAPQAKEPPFLDEFPEAKKYLFKEPSSSVYLGFGASPLSIMANKIYFAANVFQIESITDNWEIEILSADIGTTMSNVSYASSYNFTFRVSPKYRLANYLSIGPMVGYEYVSFPNLQARLNKNQYYTPFEPFSSNGPIFGLEGSELFHLGESYLFRVSEIIYKQTYSVTSTGDHWGFNFQNPAVQADPSNISPSWVFMIEFSLLY